MEDKRNILSVCLPVSLSLSLSLSYAAYSFFHTFQCPGFFILQVVGDALNSLGVFLSQELQRFNGLIEVMTTSLTSLRRAIKGEVVMSAELEVTNNQKS